MRRRWSTSSMPEESILPPPDIGFADLDGDGDLDRLAAAGYYEIAVFLNRRGKFAYRHRLLY